MRLTPTERDRLLIFTAAELARARRARGLRLNVPEAVALIADTVCEAARDGARLADAVAAGRKVLGPEDVLPGVAAIVTEVQVEAVFEDGTRLAVISSPIGPGVEMGTGSGAGTATGAGTGTDAGTGSSAGARAGSGTRTLTGARPGAESSEEPREGSSAESSAEWVEGALQPARGTPGSILPRDESQYPAPHISDLIALDVRNTASVPISVTSHFHFFEANPRLRFDRAAAYGRHLAVPAGSSVRFDPGATVHVELVPIGGKRVAIGFAGLVDGPLDEPGAKERALAKAAACGYLSVETEAGR